MSTRTHEARRAREMTVFAFDVWVTGTVWSQVVNERTAGRAKARYWIDVKESWPSIPFTAIRARKLGPPLSSQEFQRCADRRGVTFRCGQRVTVGIDRGVIVGHNSSANFDVLFDDDSARFAGLTLNVHPADICEAQP